MLESELMWNPAKSGVPQLTDVLFVASQEGLNGLGCPAPRVRRGKKPQPLHTRLKRDQVGLAGALPAESPYQGVARHPQKPQLKTLLGTFGIPYSGGPPCNRHDIKGDTRDPRPRKSRPVTRRGLVCRTKAHAVKCVRWIFFGRHTVPDLLDRAVDQVGGGQG